MKFLETKIPPLLLVALVAALMWWLASFGLSFSLPRFIQIPLVIVFLAAAVFFLSAGVISFSRAKTTVDPTNPSKASSIVSTGIFKRTRNPMYVGMAFMLFAWFVFLAALPAILGLVIFITYMHYFQIKPEERALAEKFGQAYQDYQQRVSRWL